MSQSHLIFPQNTVSTSSLEFKKDFGDCMSLHVCHWVKRLIHSSPITALFSSLSQNRTVLVSGLSEPKLIKCTFPSVSL
jgi:hypothetical protein